MAPPLRRGRALALQRLSGLVFLAVLAGLVALAVALYAKAFTPVVQVVLEADRAGNQLARGADVKARGVVVGEVREVRSDGDGAVLLLALDPAAAARIPADTRAELVPKTLFGEKLVALVFDDRPAVRTLADGDVIAQDRSTTARETAQALDALLPLLRTLRPEQVSTTLNALSSTLRGRGDRLGSSLVLVRGYLQETTPDLPVLREDLRGLADLADTLDAAAPDVLDVLDDAAAVGRSSVETEDALASFLRTTTGAAGTVERFVAENRQRFPALAAESVPTLSLFARYSPGFACTLRGIASIDAEGERVFGRGQPGLHITAEFVDGLPGYAPGDEPRNGDDPGPTCYGLDGDPVRPFPTYRNPDDGYRDGEPVDPRTGRPPGEADAFPVARTSSDRSAVGAAVAPALGLTPSEVPDVALLLYGPVAPRS